MSDENKQGAAEPSPASDGSANVTETERLAIEWAAVIAKEQSQVAVHKTLRALLERTKRTIQWSDDSK